MNFDEIVMLVKETISANCVVLIDDDKMILDGNDFDHIAEEIATALCGKETEQ